MTKRLSARLVGGGNTAFLVEALVLLMVLIATLAVFSTLFSSALVAGKHSARLNEAVLAASNEAESFSAGDRVSHKTFGPGVVKAASGDTIEVYFTRTGKTKKLMKGFAPIVKVQ